LGSPNKPILQTSWYQPRSQSIKVLVGFVTYLMHRVNKYLLHLYLITLAVYKVLMTDSEHFTATQKSGSHRIPRKTDGNLKNLIPTRPRVEHVKNTLQSICTTILAWWHKRRLTPRHNQYKRRLKNKRAYHRRHIPWDKLTQAYKVRVRTQYKSVRSSAQQKPHGTHTHRMETQGHKIQAWSNIHKTTHTATIAHHTMTCNTTDTNQEVAMTTNLTLDTDAIPIKVDNCCTRTLSNNKEDFIESTMKPVENKAVRSFSGSLTPITHTGTIKWWINDDHGIPRPILVPNSYYVPNGTARLLSPQHWAQQADDHTPNKHGTWCATYDTEIVLQ
jgi:DNA segregation ATPase FtsK/SpoIIIE-like protein